MKSKLILILFILTGFTMILPAQMNNLELGKRYIKLGGSFRESGEFSLSKEYIDKGLAIVTRHNARYWEAVGNEYLGYYWRDKAAIESKPEYYSIALDHLNKALNIFRNVIKNDPSSVNAVQMAIAGIHNPKPVVKSTKPKGPGDGIVDYGDESDDIMPYIKDGLDKLYNHQIDEAKEAFRKALEIDPKSDLAKYLLDISDRLEPYPMPGLKVEKIRVVSSLTELIDAKKKDVEIIDFSNLDLTNIPSEVFECRNLRVLNLANNEISNISDDDICTLKNLQILDLTNNNLTEIPECIKRMKKLQVLYVRGNDVPIAQILRIKDEMPHLQIVMDEEE